MKTKLLQIMKSYQFDRDEARIALEFASEVMELLADDTEEKEPYAVNSIQRYREAGRELFYFFDNLDE